MSRNPRHKQRRELKRREKRAVLRRREGLSPYRPFKSEGELVACYLNRNWRDEGMAGILVLKRIAGDRYTLCAFLVDLWCMGLKDAWGRIDTTPAEFREIIAEYDELVRVEPEVVRRLVAGGIRFARQNSFRLPHRYQRWVEILGGVNDIEHADLRDFGVEGGRLRYVGPLEDLERRLLVPPRQFLTRPDVEYMLESPAAPVVFHEPAATDDLPPPPEDPDEATPERLLEVDERFADIPEEAREAWRNLCRSTRAEVRQWCFANGIRPHPMLDRAIPASLGLSMIEAARPGDTVLQRTFLKRYLSDLNGRDIDAFNEAMSQYEAYCASIELMPWQEPK